MHVAANILMFSALPNANRDLHRFKVVGKINFFKIIIIIIILMPWFQYAM
jgi:hypothetical protein